MKSYCLVIFVSTFAFTVAAPIGTNCICSRIYNPVCGTDGRTYANDCERKCQGIANSTHGACPVSGSTPCMCQRNYDPVCGNDGNTYDNECEMNCSGAEKASNGACTPAAPPEIEPYSEGTCACTSDYNPVCGENGVWYPNVCTMGCVGVKAATDPKCKS